MMCACTRMRNNPTLIVPYKEEAIERNREKKYHNNNNNNNKYLCCSAATQFQRVHNHNGLWWRANVRTWQSSDLLSLQCIIASSSFSLYTPLYTQKEEKEEEVEEGGVQTTSRNSPKTICKKERKIPDKWRQSKKKTGNYKYRLYKRV